MTSFQMVSTDIAKDPSKAIAAAGCKGNTKSDLGHSGPQTRKNVWEKGEDMSSKVQKTNLTAPRIQSTKVKINNLELNKTTNYALKNIVQK